MAPTEGRVTKPERRWDCCRGTPMSYDHIAINDGQQLQKDTHIHCCTTTPEDHKKTPEFTKTNQYDQRQYRNQQTFYTNKWFLACNLPGSRHFNNLINVRLVKILQKNKEAEELCRPRPKESGFIHYNS